MLIGLEIKHSKRGAKEHHQGHHLIPDAVVRDHPLTQSAMKNGKPPYNLDEASNGIHLPSNNDGKAVSPDLPLHNGSHPEWNKHAQQKLDTALNQLVQKYSTFPISDVHKGRQDACSTRVLAFNLYLIYLKSAVW